MPCVTPRKIGETVVGRSDLHLLEISRRISCCRRCRVVLPSNTFRIEGTGYDPNCHGSWAVDWSPTMRTLSVEPGAPSEASTCSAKPTIEVQPRPCDADGSSTISKWGVSRLCTAFTRQAIKLTGPRQHSTAQSTWRFTMSSL